LKRDPDAQNSGTDTVSDTVSDFLLQSAWTFGDDSGCYLCTREDYEALERSIGSNLHNFRLRNCLAASRFWLLM
jgi:hypothetical protein